MSNERMPGAFVRWIATTVAAFVVLCALPKASFAATTAELAASMAERTQRVPEFQLIREEAKKLGVRAWLFGGTAAAFGHYVKWDLEREAGDKKYIPQRFDYDYTNIYRSTQDLDIVIDGNPEQAAALREALARTYPHLQGSKDASAWEVRLLRQSMGDKLAILDNPDFVNQHSDSNSTGMVEITKTPANEPPVRDVMDWDSREPNFLKDVHDGKLHYYFNPKHGTTKFAKEGRNPPILSVIRYLTKALQFELELRPEDLERIKQIVKDFDPRGKDLRNSYVSHWLLEKDNGRKLIQNAVNMEYARKLLDEVGLRKKLMDVPGNDLRVEGSLAWWLNKQPLESKPFGTRGKTAAELGIDTVAHETNSFLAYESITKSPKGEPNVFISRGNAVGEAAVHGDGFYTRVGREGARDTGITIRFKLDPRAREGSDFTRAGDYVIVKNRNALHVLPESLDWDLEHYFAFTLGAKDMKKSDRAQFEKLNRRLANQKKAWTPEYIQNALRRAIRALADQGASVGVDNLQVLEKEYPQIHPVIEEAFAELATKGDVAQWHVAERMLGRNPELDARIWKGYSWMSKALPDHIPTGYAAMGSKAKTPYELREIWKTLVEKVPASREPLWVSVGPEILGQGDLEAFNHFAKVFPPAAAEGPRVAVGYMESLFRPTANGSYEASYNDRLWRRMQIDLREFEELVQANPTARKAAADWFRNLANTRSWTPEQRAKMRHLLVEGNRAERELGDILRVPQAYACAIRFATLQPAERKAGLVVFGGLGAATAGYTALRAQQEKDERAKYDALLPELQEKFRDAQTPAKLVAFLRSTGFSPDSDEWTTAGSHVREAIRQGVAERLKEWKNPYLGSTAAEYAEIAAWAPDEKSIDHAVELMRGLTPKATDYFRALGMKEKGLFTNTVTPNGKAWAKHIDGFFASHPSDAELDFLQRNRPHELDSFATIQAGVRHATTPHDFLRLLGNRDWIPHGAYEDAAAHLFLEHENKFLAMNPTPAEVAEVTDRRVLTGEDADKFRGRVAKTRDDLFATLSKWMDNGPSSGDAAQELARRFADLPPSPNDPQKLKDLFQTCRSRTACLLIAKLRLAEAKSVADFVAVAMEKPPILNENYWALPSDLLLGENADRFFSLGATMEDALKLKERFLTGSPGWLPYAKIGAARAGSTAEVLKFASAGRLRDDNPAMDLYQKFWRTLDFSRFPVSADDVRAAAAADPYKVGPLVTGALHAAAKQSRSAADFLQLADLAYDQSYELERNFWDQVADTFLDLQPTPDQQAKVARKNNWAAYQLRRELRSAPTWDALKAILKKVDLATTPLNFEYQDMLAAIARTGAPEAEVEEVFQLYADNVPGERYPEVVRLQLAHAKDATAFLAIGFERRQKGWNGNSLTEYGKTQLRTALLDDFLAKKPNLTQIQTYKAYVPTQEGWMKLSRACLEVSTQLPDLTDCVRTPPRTSDSRYTPNAEDEGTILREMEPRLRALPYDGGIVRQLIAKDAFIPRKTLFRHLALEHAATAQDFIDALALPREPTGEDQAIVEKLWRENAERFRATKPTFNQIRGIGGVDPKLLRELSGGGSP